MGREDRIVRRYVRAAATCVIAVAAATIAALALTPPARALFTYPDPSDTYDSPVLSSVVVTGTSDYRVASFAYAPDGDLWVSQRDTYDVYDPVLAIYEPDAPAPHDVRPTPGAYYYSLAFGPGGDLYATDLTSVGDTPTVVILDPETLDVIERFGEPSGTETEPVFYVDGPSDILVETDGDVWVLNEGGSTLVHFDATTRQPTFSETPTMPLLAPRGMCLAPDGSIVVADSGNNRLVTFAPDGSVIGDYDLSTTSVTYPSDVYVDGFGTTYVLNDPVVSAATFIRIDADGSVVSTHPDPLAGETRYPSQFHVNSWGDVLVGTNDPLAAGVQRWPFIEGNPDLVAPVTTDTISSDWYRASVVVTLSASDTGKAGLAGTVYGLDTNPPVSAWPGTLTVSAEGTTTLRYRSFDRVGNWEDTRTATIRIDSFAPMTSSDALPLYHTDATITLTPLDATSGVAQTYYSLDSGPWQTGTIVTLAATQYGQHSLRWYSVDVAGNTEAPKSTYFSIKSTYDQSDPRALFIGDWTYTADAGYQGGGYLESQRTTASAFFVFTGQSVDIYGPKGPDRGRLRVRVDNYPPFDVDAYDPVAGRGWLTSFSGLASSAQHVLEVTPLDSRSGGSTGNIIGIDGVDVAGVLDPDTTPPTSTISADTQWYNPDRLLSIVSTDNTYVRSARYAVNGAEATTYTAPFGVTYDGTATVTYRALDIAGNAEPTRTASIRCDATPPTSSCSATSTSYEDSVTISFSATDTLSGVAANQYRLDGGSWITTAGVRVLGYGTHVVDYRAIDQAGNTEPFKSVTFSIRRPSVTYDIASPELTWNGSWTPFNAALRTYSSSTSNYVVGYGRSTRIKVYAYLASTMGQARVTIDGVSQLVNLYSVNPPPTPVLVFDSGPLPDKDHAFKWAWSGLGGGGFYSRVNFHSVEVEGVFGGTVPDLEPPTTQSNIPTGWVVPPFDVTLEQTDYLGNEGETFWGSVNESTASCEATNTYSGAFTLSQDGTNTVSYFSQDTYGNVENLVTETLKLDSIAPVTNSNITTDYSNLAQVTFTPVDTMSGVSSTRYSLDGAPSVTGTAFTLSRATPGHVGTHTVEWSSVDALGNREATKSADFTLLERFEDELQQYIEQEGDDWGRIVSDKHSDDLMRYAWGPGALAGTFLGDRFDLISAKRADYGIARVLIDGVEVGMVDQYSPDPLYQQKVFSLQGLGNGEHVFRIEWTGLKNPAATGTIINIDALELLGPIIGDTEPPTSICSAFGAWRQDAETVSLWATDNGVVSPRTYYQIAVDDGPLGPVEHYHEPFTVSTEGTTTIVYWSVDGVGNVEVAKTAYVRIDQTGPVVTSPNSEVWMGSPFHLIVEGSDAGCGVAQITYTVGAEPQSFVYGAPGILANTEGARTFTATAVDLLGNVGAPRVFTALLDQTAPSSDDDAAAEWVQGPASISLTSTDTGSGVAELWRVLDSGEATLCTGPFSVSGDGTHTIEYAAVDLVGNREATRTVHVLLDNTPPSTVHDAPTQWVGGTTVVHLTPSDAHSGVASTVYSLDGGPLVAYGSGVTVSGDGIHTLSFASLDAAGNREATQTATIRIDMTAPTSSDDSDPAWYSGVSTVTVSAEDTGVGVASTHYILDNGEAQTYLSPVAVSGDGTHKLHYWSTDSLGNRETTRTATVRIDITAPSAWHDAPADWVAGSAQLSLFASDMASGVDHITHRWSGSEATTYTGPVTVSDEGLRTYEYWATDIAGNRSASAYADIRVDNSPPSSAILAPASWVRSPALVSIIASDTLSGVGATYYAINGGPAVLYQGGFAILSTGETSVDYWSVDAVGNVEPTQSATVRVDDIAPTVFDDAPSGWSTGPVDVTITPTDLHSGVADVVYSLTGSEPETVYSGPIRISAEGSTQLRYAARDNLGNTSETVERIVRIDTTAPVTFDDAPASWVKGGPVSVSLTATDAVSGVDSLIYSLDGAAAADYTVPVVVSGGGVHTIAYAAVDIAGNIEATKTATIRIDDTAPVTTSNAASRYVSTATVTFSASDLQSGVSTTEYRLDGGSWTPGSSAVTTAVGNHFLEWRSTDIVGNIEATKTAAFTVFRRFEQTDSRVLYKGYWPTGNNTNHSGGSWRYESAPGATVYVIFRGTAIDLIGAKGPLYGQANLRIDGGAPVLLDYYASGYEFNRVLASFDGLSDSDHVLTIECLPTRNPASGGNYLGIDAVDVVGDVRADTTAPVSTNDAPSAWRTSNTVVALSATDSQSWVDRIRYRINTGVQYTYSSPLVITAEGTTTISHFAVDGAGNTETLRTATVRIDKTAPTTSDDAITEWTNEDVEIRLSASDAHSGVQETRWALGGGEAQIYAGPVSVQSEGVHAFSYRSSDNAGNMEETRTATLRIDKTPPVTVDDAPTGWIGGSASVSLDATDSASGVGTTEYRIDGGIWISYAGSPIVVSKPGITTLEYRSTDTAGNVEGVHETAIHIDGEAPATSSDAPGGWSLGDVEVTLTATDTVNAIAGTYYSIDGGTATEYSSPLLFTEEGTRTLEFWSEDAAGNVETPKSVEIRIDKTRPATVDDAPTGWSTESVTLTLDAGDDVSGVGSTTYSIDDGPALPYTAPIEFTTDGTRTVKYWSTDIAGNVESEKQCIVRIDTKAPWTTDDAPSGWMGGAVPVSLTAGDPVSGVAVTEYRIAEGEWTVYTDPLVIDIPGETRIDYRSTDVAGNVETLKSTTVRIDGTAPVTTSDIPETWVGSDVVMTLSATDAVNPIAATFFQVEGEEAQLYTDPVTFSAEGAVPVSFWSVDSAGNIESPNSAVVRIDKTAPVTSSDATDTYVGTASITLAADDAASGVIDTVWSLDDGEESRGTSVTVDTVGVHTLGYASIDAAGNREATRTVEFTVSERFEQTETEIGFTTGWKPSYNTFMSGGSYAWVDGAEQRATIRFAGRRLRLVATTNSNFGIAEVSLDGSAPVDVDLYSPSIGYQRPVWDTGVLPSGEHTVTISWTGRRNPASTGTIIGIDSVDVAGALEQVTLEQPLQSFEQTDGRITYAGPWSTSNNTFMSGGSYAFSAAATGVANIKFVGSRVVLVTNTNSNLGIARVSVDGTTPVDVDLYSPSIAYQRKVFELGSLAETTHTVRIEWTGRKNPASTGTAVGLDAVQVSGTLVQADAAEVVTSYEQTDRHVVYEGTWSTSNNALMSGGSYRFTNTASSTATIAFTGKRFEWYTAKSSSFGHALVSIDGGAPTLVDLYAPSILYKQRVFSSGDLAEGRHTVTITCAGTKNAASSGTYVGLDRVDMVGAINPVRYEQTHAMLAYDGSWGNSNNTAMSGGSYLYASAGAALNVRFQGTSIAWLTAKSSNFGKANVYLDGVLQGSVDLYAPSIQYQQTVWDSGVLTDGVHTLRIEWTGEKNAASSGTFVGVDALDCAGYFIPRRFEQSDVLVSQVGTWTTSNNTFMSGGSYMFATATGTAEIAFRGTRFDWLTTKNSGMGIAQVRIDGGAPVDVDLYRSTLAYQTLAWTSGTLANGNHTVSISWTGRKNPASSGTAVGVDAIDVVGSLALRRFEQVAPGIAYSTGWSNGNNALMSAGSYQYATSNGASATITFHGKQFDWITIKSSSMGIASVSIDGGEPQLVDLYSAGTKYQQTVFSSGPLANGPHTVVITRTGTKNPAASNFYVGVDAVDLSGLLTTP